VISVERNTTLVLKIIDKIIASSPLPSSKSSSNALQKAQCNIKVLQIKIRIQQIYNHKQQKV
jgi:hypothetical protein